MRANRDFWIKVASWALIIMIAPFFLELALVAEVVGVDIAVGMLLLYVSAFTTAVRQKVDQLNSLVVAGLRTHTDKIIFLNRSAFWNTASSCVVVWFGGSVLTVLMLWMPTFMIASNYV